MQKNPIKVGFTEPEKIILNWAIDIQEKVVLANSQTPKTTIQERLLQISRELDTMPARHSDYLEELSDQLVNLASYRENLTSANVVSVHNLDAFILILDLAHDLEIEDWLTPHVPPLKRKLKLLIRYKYFTDNVIEN